jgi:uncharacterized delta-60 repeat protein
MRPAGPRRRSRQRWLLLPAIVALLALQVALAAQAQARPGDLDPGFGTGGKVVTDVSGSFDDAHAVAVQPNGKIVAAGFGFGPTGLHDFALTRYRQGGTLDPTFGTGGKVILDFGGLGRFDEIRALAVRPGGRIVAAGTAEAGGFGSDFALARFRSDGTLDPGFGTGGKVTTDFGGGTDQIRGLAVQADGKLVAAGSVVTAEGGENFGVARYRPDGTLDPGFGVGGKVVTAVAEGEGFDRAQAVALQGDGKIVAAGLAPVGPNVVFALVRYHPDGTLDAGFGAGGIVTTQFDGFFNQANAVVVQAGGRIVAAGGLTTGATAAMAIAAYRPNGSLDPGFGAGGKVTIEFAGTGSADALVALAGGKLVAAGAADPGTGTGFDFALARLRHNGTLDPGFGVGGKVTTDFGGGTDVAHALAVQADGKLVAAGSPDNTGIAPDFALARYRRS